MYIGNFFKTTNLEYRNHYFSGLCFNSLTCKSDNIFFAIKGNKIDGNKFITQAIKKGAKTIISNQKKEGFIKDILYIKSLNVRKLLSEVSYKILKKMPKNLIAVTGTNGKSSIANFYLQILKLNKKKVASIGTLGLNTGKYKKNISNTTLNAVELSAYLSEINKQKIENVILEASSHGLKQHRLDGLKFNIGIFTNLSHDHLDYHKNYKDYLNSKLYLFQNLLKKGSNIITDKDIAQYKNIKKISLKKNLKLNTISEKKNDLSIVSHKYLGENQLIIIKYKNIYHSMKINLIGKIQVKNILMSIIAAEKSKIDFKKIINVIDKIKPVSGRLEKVGKIYNNASVILDYAHTPDALRACLGNLKDQFKGKKISIVFGCGGNRDRFKRVIMGKIANDYCDKIYLTDDNPRQESPKKIRTQVKKKILRSKLKETPNRKKAIRKAIQNLKTGDILVVAGKGHENIQDYGKHKKKFFSDKKIILENIRIKNDNLSKDLKINILKETVKKVNFSLKTKISKASINSREIKKNDIFFAIKGKHKDGNLFLKEAFKKGASLAVVNNYNKTEKKNNQIKVKNTLSFLSKISSKIRENSLGKIIAITGSCGKTSLKELLGASLNKFSKTMYSQKSFNNKFGVPISLFNLNYKDDFGILEVGMDKKGEINNLTKIIKPDVGVITNISYAHAKNFKDIKQIALAKSEIIQNIKYGGSLVLNRDDNFYALHKKIAYKKKIKVYSFGIKSKNANIKLNNIQQFKKKFKVIVNVNNENKCFITSSKSENNIKNILAAVAIISIFKDIKKLNINIFDNLEVPEGRGDMTKIQIYKKKIFLVDESYNSNPLSLKLAIKNFDKIKIKNNKKHLILGDMLELGKFSKKLHIEVSKTINATTIDSINVIGKYIKETYKNIYNNKKGLILNNTAEMISLIKNNINNNDYLMIKGSNSTGLHKLASILKTEKINAL